MPIKCVTYELAWELTAVMESIVEFDDENWTPDYFVILFPM